VVEVRAPASLETSGEVELVETGDQFVSTALARFRLSTPCESVVESEVGLS
jgi:hypothetical protein